MFPSLSQTKGEWVQASSPKISGTVWVDDTLLTKRRLVKMSGYFVKLFIFLYFYETKTKSINYKKQKKKNKMIIKNTSQYAPDPLNRPSKYKPPPPPRGACTWKLPSNTKENGENGKFPSKNKASPIDFKTQISLRT